MFQLYKLFLCYLTDQFPFMIRLQMKKGNERKACGGSLISNSHVLTAAHCLRQHSKSEILVRKSDEKQEINN